jgi:hypothetical protein
MILVIFSLVAAHPTPNPQWGLGYGMGGMGYGMGGMGYGMGGMRYGMGMGYGYGMMGMMNPFMGMGYGMFFDEKTKQFVKISHSQQQQNH